jgi:hypothetical protein
MCRMHECRVSMDSGSGDVHGCTNTTGTGSTGAADVHGPRYSLVGCVLICPQEITLGV